MPDESPRGLPHRFFRACLLLLGGVIALTLALQLAAQIWGWLLLIALLVAAGWVAFLVIRSWRRRHW